MDLRRARWVLEVATWIYKWWGLRGIGWLHGSVNGGGAASCEAALLPASVGARMVIQKSVSYFRLLEPAAKVTYAPWVRREYQTIRF